MSRSTARRSGRTTSTASRATFYYSRYAHPTVVEAEAGARRARRRRRRSSSRPAAGATTALVLALLAAGRHDRARRGLLLRHRRHVRGARALGPAHVEFDQTGAAARGRAARLARGAVEPVPDDARPRGRGRAPGAGRRRRDRRDARPPAPARARRRLRRCTARRSTSPATTTRCSAPSSAGTRRRPSELRDVPHAHRHRRRARPRVAPAPRPEDARGARAPPDARPRPSSPSGCASHPKVETVRYPGFGGLISFDVADGDAARRVETVDAADRERDLARRRHERDGEPRPLGGRPRAGRPPPAQRRPRGPRGALGRPRPALDTPRTSADAWTRRRPFGRLTI